MRSIDAFIGYRTNPHLDMRERGVEAAAAIREMLAGLKPRAAFIRLPIVPPTVTMLTAAGPYAEMIDLGQTADEPGDPECIGDGRVCLCRHRRQRASRRRDRAPMHNSRAAEALAREIAEFGWDNRARFYPRLTALDEAVARRSRSGATRRCRRSLLPTLPTIRAAAGAATRLYLLPRAVRGRGQGRHARRLLRSAARRRRASAGCRRAVSKRASIAIEKPPNFPNRGPRRRRSSALTDGNCVGRRGIYAGMRLGSGRARHCRSAASRSSSSRIGVQCADPVFFEMMGLDIGTARAVVVKSRGHFRGGFDEFFGPDRDRRGRSPRPDLADAEPLRLEAPAAPSHPARRQCRMARASNLDTANAADLTGPHTGNRLTD